MMLIRVIVLLRGHIKPFGAFGDLAQYASFAEMREMPVSREVRNRLRDSVEVSAAGLSEHRATNLNLLCMP
jgi:hypothetical protein